jgi:hypothetical protein
MPLGSGIENPRVAGSIPALGTTRSGRNARRGRRDGYAQFSSLSPRTIEKWRWLLVTSVASTDRA